MPKYNPGCSTSSTRTPFTSGTTCNWTSSKLPRRLRVAIDWSTFERENLSPALIVNWGMKSRVSRSGRPAISTLDTFWPSYEGRTSFTCGAVLAGGFGCGSGGLLVGGCWAASWAMAGGTSSATVRHAIAHPRTNPATLEKCLRRGHPSSNKGKVQENITCGEMMFGDRVFDALASCPPVHPAKTRQQLAPQSTNMQQRLRCRFGIMGSRDSESV